MITPMETDEQVVGLSAVMLILFEFTEVLEDRHAASRPYFEEAYMNIGDLINGIVVDEMKSTGRLIPRPLFVKDVSYEEETFYSDLGTLQAYLETLVLQVPEQYQQSIYQACKALEAGTQAFLLADRARLAPTTTAVTPWSVIADATVDL